LLGQGLSERQSELASQYSYDERGGAS